MDCANGSAYKVTPALLEELGADVITINNSPDGTNINHCCGSTDLGMLKETVLKNSADAGLAHDGDADRTLFVDEQGVEVDGDRVMALWGVEMKKENGLNKDTIVTTVMSNLGIEHYLQRKGIRILRTKVGDRYVVEKMIEGGYNLGGEQSGHIIFLDFNTTGDGPVTALQVLYLLKRKGLPLSELVSDIFLYPQVLKNVKVNRKDIINSPPLKDAVRKAELQLNGRGRVLVRPSGTEPKIRVMVEGSDRELIRRVAQRIAKAIRQTER